MQKENFPPIEFKQDEEIMDFYHDFKDPLLYKNPLCAKCKGRCCKEGGCALSPDDLGVITKKGIIEKLEKDASIVATILDLDNYAMPVLFLETREKDCGPVNLFKVSKPCASLTEQGCSYDADKRPTGGLLLFPKENENHKLCCDISEKAQLLLIQKWLRYQKLLNGLVKYYTGNSVVTQFSLDVTTLVQETAEKIRRKQKLNGEEIDKLTILPDLPADYLQDVIKKEQTALKRCLVKAYLYR